MQRESNIKESVKPEILSRSCALAAKLLGPLLVPLQVLLADCRPRVAHRLDKVLEHERRLEQLVRLDLHPGHLHRARVAR